MYHTWSIWVWMLMIIQWFHGILTGDKICHCKIVKQWSWSVLDEWWKKQIYWLSPFWRYFHRERTACEWEFPIWWRGKGIFFFYIWVSICVPKRWFFWWQHFEQITWLLDCGSACSEVGGGGTGNLGVCGGKSASDEGWGNADRGRIVQVSWINRTSRKIYT